MLFRSILESAHALEHLVPVYLGAVKLRTVDADKLGLSTDGQAAGTQMKDQNWKRWILCCRQCMITRHC